MSKINTTGVAWYQDNTHDWYIATGVVIKEPTHWMPLPPAPIGDE